MPVPDSVVLRTHLASGNTHAHAQIRPMKRAGFHDNKLVKNIRIKKDSEIVNRLTKTKVWRDVDFASDRERYDSIVRAEKREVDRQRRNQEKEEKLEREKAKEAMSYKTLFDGAEMKSTADIKETYETAQDYEDDFM